MSGATSTKVPTILFWTQKIYIYIYLYLRPLKIAPWNPPNTSRNISFVPPLQPDDRRDAERRRWKEISGSCRVSSPSSRKVYVWRALGRVEALRRGVGAGGGWLVWQREIPMRDPNRYDPRKYHWYQHRSLRPLCFLPMEVLVGKRGGSCKLFGEIFGWLRWDAILGGWQLNFFYFHPDPWGNDPIWWAYFSGWSHRDKVEIGTRQLGLPFN